MSSPPPNLDTLPITGATLFGVRVLSLRVELADGRTQRLELPPDELPAEEKLNKMRLILDAVVSLKPGEKVKAEVLSGKAGVKWNSDTKSKLATLVKEGLISLTDDGYGKPE